MSYDSSYGAGYTVRNGRCSSAHYGASYDPRTGPGYWYSYGASNGHSYGSGYGFDQGSHPCTDCGPRLDIGPEHDRQSVCRPQLLPPTTSAK